MKTLILLLNLVIFTTILNAQSVTWTGTTDADWGTFTNWNTNTVPTDGDSVVIPTTVNSPVLDVNRVIGNLIIQFGATLDFGAKTLTIKEDFTNDGSIITIGSTVIFSGVTLQKIDGNHTFHNVEINNANGVNNNWGTMSVTGVLSLQLGTFVTNNSLVLVSDSLGDASIGEISSGADISGNVDVQRYVNASATNWHFLSSPVQRTTFEDWNDDIITTGILGSDYPNWPSSADPWVSISRYDETVLGDVDSGFVKPSSISDTIIKGEGIWVWSGDPVTGNSSFTLDVKGKIYKGDIAMPVTYTNSGSIDNDGWNMVGNPYPSTIDWDAADWVKTNIDDAIYIYDPENLQYASYVSGVPNNGGSKYISSSQGFWVKASAANPVLVIKEGAKSSIDTIFFKSSLIPFSLSVVKGQYTDQASLCVNPMASLSYDAQYDAYKIYSTAFDVPSIAIISEDNEELSISSFATSEVLVIPIKVTAHSSGTSQLVFNELEGLMNFNCVILEDQETGTFVDIKTETSYSFYLNSTTDSARFLLHISNVSASFIAADTVIISENNGEYIPVINSTNGTQYSWVFGDNSTSILPSPIHHFTQEGIYNVELITTNYLGCSDVKSRMVEVIETTVSINQLSSTPFRAYPNPVKMGRSINFEFDELMKYRVEVYDLVGRSVLVAEIENNQRAININDKFKSGVYYLTVLNLTTETEAVQIIKLIVAE